MEYTDIHEKLKARFKSHHFYQGGADNSVLSVFRVGHHVQICTLDMELETVCISGHQRLYLGDIQDVASMLQLVMECNAE